MCISCYDIHMRILVDLSQSHLAALNVLAEQAGQSLKGQQVCSVFEPPTVRFKRSWSP